MNFYYVATEEMFQNVTDILEDLGVDIDTNNCTPSYIGSDNESIDEEPLHREHYFYL
jgi:hypothetical protein